MSQEYVTRSGQHCSSDYASTLYCYVTYSGILMHNRVCIDYGIVTSKNDHLPSSAVDAEDCFQKVLLYLTSNCSKYLWICQM